MNALDNFIPCDMCGDRAIGTVRRTGDVLCNKCAATNTFIESEYRRAGRHD